MRDEAFADLDTLGKETIKSYSEMNADLDSEIAEIVGVSPAEGNPGDTLSMLASYAQTEVTTVNNYIETSRELIEKLIKEKEEAMGDAANFIPVYDAQEAYAA
jgi:predicted urease superfamily metal-dependent hydrolase